MQDKKSKPIGLIEGFYGNPWTHSERLKFPKYLTELGLNTYLYCPKSDPYLRKKWREGWPVDDWNHLMAFSFECRKENIFLGIGISPHEIYVSYSHLEKVKLKEKINRILELNPGFICVLFDDMRGDFAGISITQANIANDVHRWSKGTKVLFCPTYYSFDPVLESIFGQKPIDYHETLGDLLHRDIGVLWTGSRVCSQTITYDHVNLVNKIFNRQVTIWDNYSANDGRERSKHLYLKPLPGRETAITDHVHGHLCNAMSQSELSLITLSGLAKLHARVSNPETWLEDRFGKRVIEMISRDLKEFEISGLDALSEARISELIEDYTTIDSIATSQIANRLRGQYKFDPNCLTD